MAKEKLGLGSALKFGNRNRKTDDPKAIDALVKKLNGEEPLEKVTDTPEKKKPAKRTQKASSVKKAKPVQFVSTSMKYPKDLYKRMKVYCAGEDITIRNYLIALVEKDLAKKA